MSPSDLLGQKALVQEFLSKERHESSAFSFVNIFAWKDFFHFHFEKIEENLCIFAEDSLGCFLYLPPLGRKISRETIDACFRRMNARNNGSGISRIENVEEGTFPLFSEKEFSCYQKSKEYIYRREDLINIITEGIVIGERTIDVHIAALRRKLGPEGSRIETVRGVGYRAAGFVP